MVRGVPDDALRRALDDLPHLMLRRGDDHYLLGPPALGPAVAAVPGVAAGMSRPFPPGESLRVAQREAAWAATHAAESGRGLVTYGDDTTGRWLPEDPATLTALVEYVLGKVLAYDEAHNSYLLASVRTWLEHNRHMREAATALHIHPNTLAYRLRRFSELSGRDLDSSAAFAEVWLAIRAARQLGLHN
ncbi:PucR family transcriptional regulator [Nonomuraea rubra]|uniref:PucR family transcriptional regulator n=1 Tax=Nonomuraea rubra TaxID=46180 RepID=UPI00360B1A68